MQEDLKDADRATAIYGDAEWKASKLCFSSNECLELKSIGQFVHVRASGSGNAVRGVWEISPQKKQNKRLHIVFLSEHLMIKFQFVAQFWTVFVFQINLAGKKSNPTALTNKELFYYEPAVQKCNGKRFIFVWKFEVGMTRRDET